MKTSEFNSSKAIGFLNSFLKFCNISYDWNKLEVIKYVCLTFECAPKHTAFFFGGLKMLAPETYTNVFILMLCNDLSNILK